MKWCSVISRPRNSILNQGPLAASLRQKPGFHGYGLFVLPALLLSLLVTFVPGLLTFAASLTNWDGISQPSWVGLENFRELLYDVAFWRAIFNNVKWTVLFLTVPMALSLLVASILLNHKRSHAAYQVIFLIPYVLSPIANTAIWTNIIFDPLDGVVGFLNRHLLAMSDPLGRPGSALYGVAAIDIWHFWGYLTVVFFAAMRQVPQDQLEAAMLEGANGWQVFRYVTLPNIRPTIALMFAMVTIFSFLTFDYVYLTTKGGPGYATEVLSVLAYRSAFESLEVGKAAAVALVMSLFGLIAAVGYVRLSRDSLR
jgi:raffinose/stachyose/melibiose transport system permease protein